MLKQRTADIVVRLSRIRIESHGAPHVPRRHRAAVVVAWQSAAPGCVFGSQNPTHTLLRAIRSARMDVQKGGQEVGLVVVIVETIVESRITCRRVREERIKPFDKAYVASEFIY